MTRDELINAIKVKMDIDPSDNDDYYKNFYNPIINECLSMIANTVLPYQRVIEVNYGGKLRHEVNLDELDKTCYYSIAENVMDGDVIKYKKGGWLYYEDEEWKYQPYNRYGYMIKIPYELMSFSSESLPMYISECGDVMLDPDILYINSKTLALPKDGDYKIWYNSEYPEVTDNNAENIDFIPKNVARIIPSYVAGQLLMSEDPVRATILKNDFETQLSRLDDNKVLAAYEIHNASGWTR